MTNWTRAHDAWIARECEGLAVEYRISGVGQSGPVDWCFLSPMPFTPHGGEPQEVWVPIKHYLTDHAAAIRAAEAWASKAPEGTKRVIAIVTEYRAGEKQSVANLQQNDYHEYCGDDDNGSWSDGGPDAYASLAQALYRATGGPA